MLFATWYEGLAPLPADATLNAERFTHLLELREQVAKVLEPMRASGEIGPALEDGSNQRRDVVGIVLVVGVRVDNHIRT